MHLGSEVVGAQLIPRIVNEGVRTQGLLDLGTQQVGHEWGIASIEGVEEDQTTVWKQSPKQLVEKLAQCGGPLGCLPDGLLQAGRELGFKQGLVPESEKVFDINGIDRPWAEGGRLIVWRKVEMKGNKLSLSIKPVEVVHLGGVVVFAGVPKDGHEEFGALPGN